MKKNFTFLAAIGSMYFFAQNSSGNLHVFNDNTNHSLDLNFTLFTIVPSTCSTGIQGIPSGMPLTAGGVADYTTFAAAASTATSLNPYPFNTWYTGGSYVPASGIPPFVQAQSRWHYMKFELKDPTNPGTITPTLGGSVGFYPACGGIPATIAGSGTLGASTYNFSANAFTFGRDLWITVQ
jgi:hypothetical protein